MNETERIPGMLCECLPSTRDRKTATETEEDEYILIHHNSETSGNMMDVHLEEAKDDDYVFRMHLVSASTLVSLHICDCY